MIGCGAIGSKVAELQTEYDAIELVGICDPYISASALPKALAPAASELLTDSLTELIARKPNVILEAAGHQALKDCATPVLEAGIDLFIVSVGALCDSDLYKEVAQAAARKSAGTSYITSGAIGGMDFIQALKLAGGADGVDEAGGIKEAQLISIKPPQNFMVDGLPPEIKAALQHQIDANADRANGTDGAKGADETKSEAENQVVEVFSGSAKDAALAFPQSANVCATLGFATLGIEKTKAVLLADPNIKKVTHKISLKSKLGEHMFVFQNYPSEKNPKTSAIVAYSVLRGLVNLAGAYIGGLPGVRGLQGGSLRNTGTAGDPFQIL